MDRDPKGYYARLDVTPGASGKEIKRKYRQLSHEFHPDHGGDEEEFKEINAAYEVLGDPKKRARYDRLSSGAQTQTSTRQAQGQEPRWQQTWSPPAGSSTTPPRQTAPPPRSSTPPPRQSPPPPRQTPPPRQSRKWWLYKRAIAIYVFLLWIAIMAITSGGHSNSHASRIAHGPEVNWAIDGKSFQDSNIDDSNYGICNSYTLTKSLLVYSGSVYDHSMGSDDNDEVVGFNRSTGKELWSISESDWPPPCPPLVDEVGQSLFYDAGDGLIQLNRLTGIGVRRSYDLDQIFGRTGIEAAYKGTSYYSLPSASSESMPVTFKARCIVEDTCPDAFIPGAYINWSGNGYVTKLIVTKGKLLWQHANRYKDLGLFAYDSHQLVLSVIGPDESKFVVAVNLQNGKKVWSIPQPTLWAQAVGKYFLLDVVGSYQPAHLISVAENSGRYKTVKYSGKELKDQLDSYVIAVRGGKDPQAVVRSDNTNWRVDIRTGNAKPLVIGSQNLSNAHVNHLEAGDSRDLILLKSEPTILMSVKW